MKDIAVFGAGGFGREVACIIKRINKVSPTWNFIGFFDDNESLSGTKNEYGTILGTSNDLNLWKSKISIAIGVGSPNAVYAIVSKIKNNNVDYPNIIDPTVIIADEDNYALGIGNIFAPNCIISIATNVGNFNTFNTNTVLGHDDNVEDFNSFMPNVNISGGVKIGSRNFFGAKTTVLQYLKIGTETTVGANSLVIRNTKDGKLYMGNPAKKIEL